MKILIALLTCLLFLSCPLKASEPLPQESELFFNSFLFTEYHSQLKNFVQTQEAAAPSEEPFIRHILTYKPGTAEQNRAFYLSLMDELRSLIKENPNSRFIDNFCVWLFESVNMWDSLVEMQNRLFPAELDYKEPMSCAELFAYTEEIYAQTLDSELYNGCQKVSKETNDQMRFGNFPYTLYKLDKTLVIRIPSVTKEVEGRVEIAEEFSRYLDVLRQRNKKHLYVNLITQKYGKPSPTKDPECRKKIEALESKTFFAVTLDKNSPFYFQSDEYAGRDNAEEFIDTFASKLFSKDSMYTWPSSLDFAEWQSTCLELLREIHAAYFKGKETLSVDERQDFIHIAYIEIIKKLVKLFDVDTMNISCVNTVDRGISLLSELYLDHVFQKGPMITRKEAERFTSLVLIHPIVLRNRPAHVYRLERIISATKRMHHPCRSPILY